LIIMYIDPGSFIGSLEIIKETPFLFVLNVLPIILLCAAVFFISNNSFFSVCFSGALFILMAVVNREKVLLRQDPFIPSDIALFNEAFGIVKNFPPKQLIIYSIFIVALLLFVIVSLIVFKSKKIKLYIRAIGLVITVLLSLVLNNSLYSDEKLYSSFRVNGNVYFDVNQYSSKGFVYSFIHKYNTMKIQAPENYNPKEFSSLSDETNITDTEKKPHIIMIMAEAYSDLSENKHIDFSSFSDPMENYKKIISDENSLSGHIIVPNFGGGTSNTEFEVLTGYSTKNLVKDAIAYNYIRNECDSIPQRLKDLGYTTLAIHPGFSWFYNRLNVYNSMGFDNFIHLSSFQGEEKYKGGYIADKYLTDSIIENFESHIENNDNPMFQFCVSIENHGPYDDKYTNVETMFESDIELTDTEETLLNSYFMGIRDADIELKRLVEYFSSIDEPVMLVYFGDHLPGFSNGMEFFPLLEYDIDPNGTIEESLNVYATPFFIWQNDNCASLTDYKTKLEESNAENGMKISASFLGALCLELAGQKDISPFISCVNNMRKDIYIIRDNSYLLSNGTYTDTIDEEEKEILEYYKNYSYYKFFE